MSTGPRILLVEDNEDDRFLAVRTLAKAGLHAIYHAPDGKAALDYFLGNPPYSNRKEYPLPDVILLDLKIPEINGHQVLEWIKVQPGFSTRAVYVLSSSGEARDRKRAADGGVADYFVKPLTLEHIAVITARFEKR